MYPSSAIFRYKHEAVLRGLQILTYFFLSKNILHSLQAKFHAFFATFCVCFAWVYGILSLQIVRSGYSILKMHLFRTTFATDIQCGISTLLNAFHIIKRICDTEFCRNFQDFHIIFHVVPIKSMTHIFPKYRAISSNIGRYKLYFFFFFF